MSKSRKRKGTKRKGSKGSKNRGYDKKQDALDCKQNWQ